MGCCQSKSEAPEISLEPEGCDDFNLFKTEEDFSDVSLESPPDQNKTFQSKPDSVVYYTRSSSISVHRTELENAFLHSPALGRRYTLDISRIDTINSIQEE